MNAMSVRRVLYAKIMVHPQTHTGDKPYECNVCEESFAYRNTLMQHMFIHTGEQPYECDIWLKALIQLSILKQQKVATEHQFNGKG